VPIPQTLPPFGDVDISYMTEMQVAVTVGGVNGMGWIDDPDQIVVQDHAGGEVVVRASVLTVQTSAFPAAAIGQIVTVTSNGKTFTVRERLGTGDGAISKFLLGTAT
jgi:hypothetical protein